MDGVKVSLGTLVPTLMSHFLMPSAQPAAIATPSAVISHMIGLTANERERERRLLFQCFRENFS